MPLKSFKTETDEIKREILNIHGWYINNQIILSPERDDLFYSEIKQFLHSRIDKLAQELIGEIEGMRKGLMDNWELMKDAHKCIREDLDRQSKDYTRGEIDGMRIVWKKTADALSQVIAKIKEIK